MMLIAILATSLLGQPYARISTVLMEAVTASQTTSQEQAGSAPSAPQSQAKQEDGSNQSSKPKETPGPTEPEKAPPCTAATSDCKPTQSRGCKGRRHKGKPRAATSAEGPAPAPSDNGPAQKIVRDGGATEPVVELSPAMSTQQISDQRASTTQLLAKSAEDLKQITARQLSESQQDTVKQIKSYMDQATQADKDGDVQRAHNLAVKANLLSTELTKP
jgi:hypothetical protein